MSIAPQVEAKRVVVTVPTVGATRSVSLLKAVPIWFGSAAIHIILILALGILLWLVGYGQATPALDTEVIETDVTEAETPDIDLTNTDIGIDSTVLNNLNLDRIEEVTVPGEVNPTEAVGIDNAPEKAPETVPLPPGIGEGTGAALPGDLGAASAFGAPGGMDGIALVGSFGGRSGATREKMLQEGGGNELSEAAVARGLKWLAHHQSPDGHWSLHQFNHNAREMPWPKGRTFTCNCGGTTTRNNDVAGTAFGVLPFLAAGITQRPPGPDEKRQVDYHLGVRQALKWLMSKQGNDGGYTDDMYAHGLATIAMCEAYGMTSDPLLKISAQKALGFIVSAQDASGGGWRYRPRQPGDTSVTGWQLMALKSGQMAGLSVPRATLKGCDRFLDSVESSSQKGLYAYMPGGRGASPTMTSVGMLCRQYLGVKRTNPGLINGTKYLQRSPPAKMKNNMYYLYYATQVMHHMGGDSWQFWNLGPKGDGKGGIRDVLITKQSKGGAKRGHENGSWAPAGHDAGRVMSTSLSLLCLEVYYRHLPLYRRNLATTK
jgi:hypothetical protein